jgi:hypothetical protein
MMRREGCVPTAPNLLEQVKLLERRGWAHLDLQQVIATNALVVHLMVCVIGIPTALVLNESEAKWLAPVWKPRRVCTYSLLEAERGAGMPQRTSLP